VEFGPGVYRSLTKAKLFHSRKDRIVAVFEKEDGSDVIEDEIWEKSNEA
jgi:hypothetical protein